MLNPVDYDQLAALCWQRGSMTSPSELQGFLLGHLAIAEPYTEAEWYKDAEQLLDAVEPLDEQDQSLLKQLYQDCCALLQDGDMGIALLLPDDDVELNQRVECLGFSCQGFLQGFALAGKKRMANVGKQAFSEMVSEALNDIAAIAQISLADDESNEEAERNLEALIEHVRLAIVNVFLECSLADNEPSKTPKKSKLH